MKTMAIFCAAGIRYLKPAVLARFSSFELSEAVRARYHFTDTPTARELAMPVTPGVARFFYGKMEAPDRPITIEQLIVTCADHRTTVLEASTRSSTDDADAFLEDLVGWGRRRYGIDTEAVFAPAYRSLLEVSFDKPIGAAFGEIHEVGRTITHLVKDYGRDCPPFELAGLRLNAVSPIEGAPELACFSLERCADSAPGENRYLAQAPLRTHDHETLLAEMEKLLAGRGRVGIALMDE